MHDYRNHFPLKVTQVYILAYLMWLCDHLCSVGFSWFWYYLKMRQFWNNVVMLMWYQINLIILTRLMLPVLLLIHLLLVEQFFFQVSHFIVFFFSLIVSMTNAERQKYHEKLRQKHSSEGLRKESHCHEKKWKENLKEVKKKDK